MAVRRSWRDIYLDAAGNVAQLDPDILEGMQFPFWRAVFVRILNLTVTGCMISNLGRFRNASGRTRTPRCYDPRRTYALLSLQSVGGGMAYVHRLVLLMFRGGPPADHTADHIDIDPRNNRLNNLRWATVADQNANRNAYEYAHLQQLVEPPA